MYKFAITFILLVSVSLPSRGQYKAIQSTAGGVATSSSYSIKMTTGEPIPGAKVTSTRDTLITGFYFERIVFVDVIGPVILFSEVGDQLISPLADAPPSPFVLPEGQDIAVSTQITDGSSGVQDAVLYYRKGGEPAFSSVNLDATGDVYSATVDGAFVNSAGFEYYVEARDNSDNTSRSPVSGSYGIRVRIEGPGLEQMFPGDSTQTGYRLISVPMQLTNTSSSSVLEDLGPYNNRLWRFWELKSNYGEFEGEEQYNELTNGANFTPGDAYWLISRNAWTIQTGQATSISTLEPFTQPLNPGWNFVGNPFNFIIPTENVTLSTGDSPSIKVYSAGWIDATQLSPFEGYAIDAGENDNAVITIDPDLSPSSGKQGASQGTSSLLDWSIRITAEGTTSTDSGNLLGVSSAAASGWDVLDKPEPPVIGDYVSLAFPHKEWQKIHDFYEADIRPAPIQGEQWTFEVRSGSPQWVDLTFDAISQVPPQYSIILIDERTKSTQDLRQNHTFSIQSNGPSQAYPLTLVIGEQDYVEDQKTADGLLPGDIELDQNYPNPFNPSTSIRYGISTPSIVKLEVFNTLGQVVSTLVNSVPKEAGYHLATWNALTEDGAPVSSGLYLYRLSVYPENGASSNPAVLTRKMMLIK